MYRHFSVPSVFTFLSVISVHMCLYYLLCRLCPHFPLSSECTFLCHLCPHFSVICVHTSFCVICVYMCLYSVCYLCAQFRVSSVSTFTCVICVHIFPCHLCPHFSVSAVSAVFSLCHMCAHLSISCVHVVSDHLCTFISFIHIRLNLFFLPFLSTCISFYYLCSPLFLWVICVHISQHRLCLYIYSFVLTVATCPCITSIHICFSACH